MEHKMKKIILLMGLSLFATATLAGTDDPQKTEQKKKKS
jgi:hypothetical protein